MDSGKQLILNEWIEKAQHDLNAATIIFQHLPDHIDTVAFHCQQSTEKYLKALIFYFDIEVIKTHDLIMLIDLLSDKIEIPDTFFEMAAKLNFYSVEIRYPQGRYKPNKDDIMMAINYATKFKDYVIEEMSK